MAYHNNFFNKDSSSHRQDLYKRLDFIKEALGDHNYTSLADIGCSEGFNSFGLHTDFTTIDAFDFEQELVNDCLRIQKTHKTDINFYNSNVLEFVYTDTTYDVILYLSTHHHVINQLGFERATANLAKVFDKCTVMFFDMGQKDENCPTYGWWQKLPSVETTQEEWLRNYLEETTNCTNLEKIGSTSIHNTQRLLWKLEK